MDELRSIFPAASAASLTAVLEMNGNDACAATNFLLKAQPRKSLGEPQPAAGGTGGAARRGCRNAWRRATPRARTTATRKLRGEQRARTTRTRTTRCTCLGGCRRAKRLRKVEPTPEADLKEKKCVLAQFDERFFKKPHLVLLNLQLSKLQHSERHAVELEVADQPSAERMLKSAAGWWCSTSRSASSTTCGASS